MNLTDQQTRQLCADIGICDDRQERVIVDMNRQHNIDMELMRARVTEREWALENELMEMRCKYESA